MDLRKEVGPLHCSHFSQNSSKIIVAPGKHHLIPSREPSPVCVECLSIPGPFCTLGSTQLLDEHRAFWCIWSCKRATGVRHEVVAASPERPPSPAVLQNCFLWACILLQVLSREGSKPWSRLCPSHHPPWCIRLPAVDKFSCGTICSPRDDAFLSDCYQSGILSFRVLQTFGSWKKCMVSQDHFRSRPVHQLGHRRGSIGLHPRALMHMAGWLLPEWSLLLENLSTFLLFPFFPMCFLGACGLHWCYAWGEGS